MDYLINYQSCPICISSLFGNNSLFFKIFFSFNNIYIVILVTICSTNTENKAISICVTFINTYIFTF